MLDGNTAALDQFERQLLRNEREYKRKLAEFRNDPYSYCEWNIDAFSKYDLLSIALEAILADFDDEAAKNFGASNQCARRDILAAIEGSVQEIEL